MRAVKDFNVFLREGIVKKQAPDKSRANFLVKEAERDYSFLMEMLRKFEISDKNSNSFVKSCYDILMEIVRSKMLEKGYNASGFGAHEAEVSYLRLLGFSESDVQFTDQMRYFRNGMLYYGTILDKEYAELVIAFTKKLYSKLMVK